MKKIIATFVLVLSLIVLSTAQVCNTSISKVSSKSKKAPASEWCVKITANKLLNQKYPYFAEFKYTTVLNNDTAILVRTAFDVYGNWQQCKSYFKNIKSGSSLSVRTINFSFDRLWGTNDPNSQYYNPYYGKSDQQIYAEIKDDSSKWCQGNTIIVP